MFDFPEGAGLGFNRFQEGNIGKVDSLGTAKIKKMNGNGHGNSQKTPQKRRKEKTHVLLNFE